MNILAFLTVLFTVISLAFPVFAQTAREKLKNDPIVVATELTETEKDALIDRLKYIADLDKAAKDRAAALEQMEKLLRDDAQLKTDLMSE